MEPSVADTGIGIPEHELPRIFDRFRTVKGRHGRTHAGSGTGLARVCDLAKLHRGSVGVESTDARCSRFTVCIPLEARASAR